MFYYLITLWFSSLAPGSYDVDKAEKIVHQSSGAITFGIKYKDQKPEDIPGEIEFTSILFKAKNSHWYVV